LAAAARDQAARRVALYQQLAHITLPQAGGPPTSPNGQSDSPRGQAAAVPAGAGH